MASSNRKEVIDLTKETDEIIVENEKVPLLRQYATWIQDNHDVKLIFGKVTNLSDGICRWIGFEGKEDSRKKAKEYVKSLCSATSEVKMRYPVDLHSLLTNTTVRSHLEDHSKAVLKFGNPGEVTILGLDPLPVTLAMSALEDIINKHMDNLEDDLESMMNTQASKSEASARLDMELRRLSSEEGNQILAEDYSSTNNAVKRTILSWMLEGSGENQATSKDKSEPTTPMELGMTVQQLEQIQLGQVAQVDSSSSSSSSLEEEESELSSASGSPKNVQTSLKSHNLYERHELHENCLAMGYSDEDINEVFSQHGDKLSASEFIQKLVENARAKSSSSAESLKPSTSLPKPPSEAQLEASPSLRPKCLDQTELKMSKHLGGYLEERRKHHEMESGATDIEELKKNNHKRQQLLKEAMEKQESERMKKTPVKNDDGDVKAAEKKNPPQKRNYQSNSPQPNNQKKNRNQRTIPHLKEPSQAVVLQEFSEAHGAASSTVPQSHMQQIDTQISARPKTKPSNLRYIVIDGSNIAMSHGNGRIFSCKGIKICIDYFRRRGHSEITAFVPQWRTRDPTAHTPISDQHILQELKNEGFLVYTPARRVPGKNIVCYDDKFIIRLAEETGGIMVSNDNYRDLWQEKREWREIIEKRLTGYSFVGDIFMLPDDPLGRDGPTLDEFLTKTPQGVYGRGDSYVTRQQAPRPLPIVNYSKASASDQRQFQQPLLPTPMIPFQQQMQPPIHNIAPTSYRAPVQPHPAPSSANIRSAINVLAGPAQANPPQPRGASSWQQVPARNKHKPQQQQQQQQQQRGAPNQTGRGGGNGGHDKKRTPNETQKLYEQLQEVFEGNERRILDVLEANPTVKDMNRVSTLILDGM